MKRFILLLVLALGTLTIFASSVQARIGVGVGTGEIQLDERLQMGMVYSLPSITVINTGNESGDYLLDTAYHQDQEGMRPPREWFTFSPATFSLDSGESQVVEVTLTLPVQMIPGDYFAYLEARPTAVSNKGGASIGIAAASKLYFTVAPANLLQGLWYRSVSIWQQYTPYSQLVVGSLAVLALIKVVKHYLSFNISIKPKSKQSNSENNSDES